MIQSLPRTAGCYRHYDPVSPGAAPCGSERWARGGDCGSTSPRSLDELAQLRTHTAHYSPVMIAPLSINSSHADCRPARPLFFFLNPAVRADPINASSMTTIGAVISPAM